MNFKCVDNYKQLYNLWQDHGIPVDQPGSLHEKGYEEYFNTHSNNYIGCYINGELIASCVLFNDERKIGIYRLCVQRSYRKKGIAKKLLEYCEKLMLDQGINTVYALIKTDNKESIGLFAKCGFSIYPNIQYHVKKISAIE